MDSVTQIQETVKMKHDNLKRTGVIFMAKIYAELIRKGKKTIEDVPARLRAEVEAILAEPDDE